MDDGDLHRLVGLMDEPTVTTTLDGVIEAANARFWSEIAPHRPRAIRLQEIASDPKELADNLAQWAATAQWLPGTFVVRRGDRDARYRASGCRLSWSEGPPRVLIRLREHHRATAMFTRLNTRIADLSREVGRRVRAEARLAGELVIVELIARGAGLPETLEAIARFAEAESSALTSVLVLDDAGRLRLGAAPSLPDAYNEAIDGLMPGPSVGSCGTAVHRKEPVVVADIANDPLWADFADLALEHELRACWSTPVLDASGEVVATVANYYRQVGEPTVDDDRVIAAACHLTAIAIERHRDAAELSERAERLEEANRRKNEFLAMLGHELRNPLSPMVTAVELLQSPGATEAKRQKYLAILDRQLGLMRRLVDDLLEIARVTRGKITLTKEVIDLRSVLTAAWTVDGDDPRVQVAMPDEEAWVYGDADRLQQVVQNLVHNARKFTPSDGHIAIELSVSKEAVRLGVRDDGAGIDPADLPSMFDLFAQGPRALDRSDGGLGIGLTLVKSLVEAHGGEVTARSEGLGKGSEFEIRLPRVEPPSSVVSPERPSTLGRKLDIVVVDDDEDGAAALATLLREWGHSVRVEHEGRAAISACLERPPELVVLDIGLPGMDGFQVVETLRRELEGTASACTLVAHSGYGQKSDVESALAAGFDAFLVKPVDIGELKAVLKRAGTARRRSC